MNTKKLDEALLKLFGEFDENFITGLTAGFMALSVILYRSFGLGFAMSANGQMHLVSLDVIFLMIPIFYRLLSGEPNNGKRVLASLCFPVFVFSIHDIAWVVETHFIPPVFLVPIAEIDLQQYVYHYCKNAVNIIISTAFIYRYFKVSKLFILGIILQVGFHVFNIIYKINIYVLNPYALIVMYLFDIFPYFFCIRR